MRVLILEPHASGHHASYLRWLVQAADRTGWSVVVAITRAALSHPSLTTLASEFSDVQFQTIDDPASVRETTIRPLALIHKEYEYWRIFKNALTKARAEAAIDAVILPYVDYCFYALGVLGSPFQELPWCGISMRLSAVQNAANGRPALTWKWRIAKRVLKEPHLKALFSINPSMQEMQSGGSPESWLSKLRYLPDPGEYETGISRVEARMSLGIGDGDIAILVFGLIDERKGIDALLTSLLTRNDLANCMVILAGKQSAKVSSEMRTAPFTELLSRNRLVVLDRVLSDAEKGAVFSAADVVWLGYRNHPYMSGVMVLAGLAGLPVVGTVEGEIGRLISERNLGAVARIDHPEEVALALGTMQDAGTRARMGCTARSVFADHTVRNFGARVMAALS